MNYSEIFFTMLPYLLIAGVGGASNRFGLTRGKPEKLLLKLLINLLIPSLIINFVVGNPALEDLHNVAVAPLIGFYGIVIGYLTAWFTAKYFGIRERLSVASFAFTVGIYNFGFLSIPLTEVLFGKDVVGVLLVHNLGIDSAYWSVGVGLLTGFSAKNLLNLIKNPPLLAIITSLIINFMFGREVIPAAVESVLGGLAFVAIPVGVFISGAALAESAGAFKKEGSFAVSAGAVLLRMFVIPLMMVYSVKFMNVSPELKMVTAVQASMPAGMLSIAIVKYFGGDTEVSVQTILTTTVVSIFTIPLWIKVFLYILGV
jgi:predicted permease